MPSRFLLRTFGGLTLAARDGGEAVLVNQRKRLAFIAALAADPNGGIARERLFALLWPESDGERSRNALNQIVFAIRRDLGEEAILTDTISIRLNPAVVDSDLRIFRDALAGGRFIDAVEAYGGPFLDGVFLRETPEFERWVSDTRRSFAQDYARALEQEIDADNLADEMHTRLYAMQLDLCQRLAFFCDSVAGFGRCPPDTLAAMIALEGQLDSILDGIDAEMFAEVV